MSALPPNPLRPIPSRWTRVWNLIVRNRRRLGGMTFALWTVAQSDPWIVSRPRLNAYAGAIVAYVLGAGVHKSDKQHREEQGRLGLLPSRAGRPHLP